MKQVTENWHSEEKRTVLDGLGHHVEIRLQDGKLGLCVVHSPNSYIEMTRQEAEIFHAFLGVSLRNPRKSGRRETLLEGKWIELVDSDNPRIRISDGTQSMEIHPASWDAVMCEIALLLPRMTNGHG